MATLKPDLTRVWANGAPPANVVDPDTTTPGKVNAGWQAEVPPFEHFNFLQKWFTQGLAHFNEQGIGVWDSSTTYPVDGMAKGSDGEVYRAIVEQSGNDPVSDDGTNWRAGLLTPKSLGLHTDLSFGSVQEMVDNEEAVTYSTGMVLETSSYYDKSEYTGKAYGGAKYIVTVADSDKITAGIQIALAGMLAAELIDYNDVYISQIGALDSSTQDAVTKIQPYVDYFKDIGDACRLKIELTTYFFFTTLDLLNIGNNSSITIEGVSKSRINSRGTGSIIYGNTGNNAPVILVAGTENVNFEKFSIISELGGSLGSPSTLGIVLARTASKSFCQFINFKKIHVSLASIPTVNNNYGSIGIYNYASETHDWSDVSIRADSPMIMTTTNIAGITYTDYFDNTGTEAQNTTTNFDYKDLQLYPITNSPIVLDIVRDLSINTVLGFPDSDLLKYFVEFQGILPNRRIKIKNIHTEKIRRGFRIENPLLESEFEGKMGTGITDKMALVVDDGRMKQVEFKCFNSSSGTVTMIDDITSNESFDVVVRHSRETNGPNVLTDYNLGSAVYNQLHIYNDNQWATINSSITSSVQSNIIYLHGTDGVYPRGTYFRGTSSQRPTTGLYVGKEYFDTDLGKTITWDGSAWIIDHVFTATTAELEDITSDINTKDKTIYKQVMNTDTVKPVWAAGISDSSTWRDATGSVAHTPT